MIGRGGEREERALIEKELSLLRERSRKAPVGETPGTEAVIFEVLLSGTDKETYFLSQGEDENPREERAARKAFTRGRLLILGNRI